jgi:hypothetical protein
LFDERLIEWEAGELNEKETTHLFSDLIKSGLAWQLQGCYGRQAVRMIEAGILDKRGNIL